MAKTKHFDVDLDFGNREQALALIKHVPATIARNGRLVKHNTGVYVTQAPQDSVTGWCSLDYETADKLGYFKLDFLNVGLYQQVRDPQHLKQLVSKEPLWELLQHREFVEKLMHLNNHYDLMQRMPEPINSIPRLAMMLAVIRPGKRHLVGLPWAEVAKTVWERDGANGFTFKKAHGTAYAVMIAAQCNLIEEQVF